MSIQAIKAIDGIRFLYGLQLKLENTLLLKSLPLKHMMKMECQFKVA